MIRKLLISVLFGMAFLTASGCVYQANLSQGNLLKQEDLDQVEVGMTRAQVRFLLGTPMVDDPFHNDRWDYVYFLRVGRNSATFKRWVSIYYSDDTVRQVVDGVLIGENVLGRGGSQEERQDQQVADHGTTPSRSGSA